MAGNYAENLVAALEDRAPELAKASNEEAVQTIVREAETEATRLTEVPNTFVYQATVIVLGISVISVIFAQVWITLVKGQAEIPDGLIAIGSAAIGALAGLLAPTPAG